MIAQTNGIDPLFPHACRQRQPDDLGYPASEDRSGPGTL